MRVLNDEEIGKELGWNNWDDYSMKAPRMSAQAQLKRDIEGFIEWGEEVCAEHYGSYLYIRRRQCDRCWDEFKKLMEAK